MKEIRVQSLGGEDPLEAGTAIFSSILAWRIPGTEESGGLQSIDLGVWLDWNELAHMHAQFANHRIYSFKVYDTVFSRLFTGLCKHYSTQFIAFSSSQKSFSYCSCPPPISPQSQSTANVLCISIALPILGISYKRNHRICGLLWLTSFM